MLEIWGLPLIVGLTMLGVFYYVSLGSRRLINTLQQLYRINQDVDQDALEFIKHAWPVLQSAGFSGLQQEIYWFGEQINHLYGEAAGHSLKKTIEGNQMQATLVFYLSTSRGERKILGNLLINTFILIISSDFAAKRQQVAKTSEQLSRQQLFAQHDAKNLAQFISLLDEQIRQVRDDQDRLALFEHIRNSMPVVVERARRLHPRSVASNDLDDIVHLDLHTWLKKLSSALGLKIDVQGDDVEYHGPEKPLYDALKNVLENFQQHTSRPHTIHVQLIHGQDNVQLKILANKPENLQLPPAERMFEPFYTTSKSGMGLGLYLARSALTEISGNIRLISENNHYGFLINVRQ